MHRRASQVPAFARLEADVVVVGAGPLGIVVALELADSGQRVLLVESGSLRPDRAAQDLSESDGCDDQWHAPKSVAVRRQFGGTSVLWGGRSLPFDPIDFEPRPAQPEDRWPIQYKEFAGYLERACRWCRCGRAIFSAWDLPELASRSLVAGLPDGLIRTTNLERWSLPTRFGKEYRRPLLRHPNIDLITGLTCVHIACEAEGDSVAHLELRGLGGEQCVAVARHYVLATGGLEATRLLLASNDVHKDGIGNHSGHLGRWYMAHVEARVARLHLSTPPESTIYDHEVDVEGVYVRRRFTVDPAEQRRAGLLNAAVWIVNPEMGDPSHGSGILSGVYLTLVSPIGRFLLAEAIRQAGTKTKTKPSVLSHVQNIMRDLVPSARFALTFAWSRFLRPGRKAPGFFVGSAANVYPLHYHGEHAPHWESRVELSNERDALGMRRLRTRIHFDDEDVRNVRLTMERIDEYLREHQVGHLEYISDDIEASVWSYLEGNAGYHQTGTTRMSASPDDGVVDSDLCVHGVRNLSIASTSVLPTSSQANPTLTGVALAVRLADHIAGGLG